VVFPIVFTMELVMWANNGAKTNTAQHRRTPYWETPWVPIWIDPAKVHEGDKKWRDVQILASTRSPT
jgi:hypothetical protein